jgi:hypothetical protein
LIHLAADPSIIPNFNATPQSPRTYTSPILHQQTPPASKLYSSTIDIMPGVRKSTQKILNPQSSPPSGARYRTAFTTRNNGRMPREHHAYSTLFRRTCFRFADIVLILLTLVFSIAPQALDNLKAKLKGIFSKKKKEEKKPAETKPTEAAKPTETTAPATTTEAAAPAPATAPTSKSEDSGESCDS